MIDPVNKFRGKLLLHGHQRDLLQFLPRCPPSPDRRLRTENRSPGVISRSISLAPRLLVRKTRLFSKFTTELSPSRRIPRSSTPSSSRVSEGAAFSISSNSTSDKRALVARHRGQLLLGQHWLRFTMPQISRRRANQFRNLVLHLEFTAIDFQDILRTAMQRFGERLHRAGFAGPGGTQQQKNANWPILRRKTRPETFRYRGRLH